jgi:hypothetical protein
VEEMAMSLRDDAMFKRFSDFARHPEKQDAHMEALLGRIRERLPKIEELLVEIADHWGEEDGVYRFYHQSFKVFGIQQITKKAFTLIEEIGGETDPLNGWYCQIVKEGTEGDFRDDTNEHWPEQTRPILEAFWHTKYFLAMMAKYGKELQSAPRALPSGSVRALGRKLDWKTLSPWSIIRNLKSTVFRLCWAVTCASRPPAALHQ